MKKAMALLLILSCLLGMSACGGEKDLGDTFIDETPIYNENGISVSATGISHVEDAYILHIKVDNRTNESLIPVFYTPVANGLHLPFEVLIYRNVNPCEQILGNSAATVDLCLSTKEFALTGMDALTQLDFAMALTGVSSREARMSQAVSIPVRSHGSISTPNFGGEVIFSKNDIQVSYKLVDGKPYFFMINNYRRALAIFLQDVTINGYYYDYVGLTSDFIQPGMCTVETFSNLEQLMMPPGDTAEVELTVVVSDAEGFYFNYSNPIRYTSPMYETGRCVTQQPQVLFTNDQMTIWADRFYDKALETENVYFRIENNTDSSITFTISGCQLDGESTDSFTHNHIAADGFHYTAPLFRRHCPAKEFSQITLQYSITVGNETLLENQTAELTFLD